MTANDRHAIYECARCGNCCRWPGPVRVDNDEIEEIARFLEMSPDEFRSRFIRLINDRTALSLTEKPDGSCAFLEGNDCLIHDVKPNQCRDFPNKWNFVGFEELCNAKFVGFDAAKQRSPYNEKTTKPIDRVTRTS